MAVMAFVSAIFGAGANGSPLAYGIGISLCSLIIYFALFSMLYWVAYFLSVLLGFSAVSGGKRKSKNNLDEISPEADS